jgi:hypothetical protein
MNQTVSVISATAFGAPEPAGPAWERRENPQVYDSTPYVYTHPDPKRHILGTVAGNNVSQIRGSMIDLESDLRGITIPTTKAPWRQYQAPASNQTTIERSNTKGAVNIDVRKEDLRPYQMWAYPGTYAPEPIRKETCGRPEKY